MKKPQPLGRHFLGEKVDAGRVAVRAGEVGDQTDPHRVLANAEDDRDRWGRGFGRERCRRVAGCGYDRHPAADEVLDERWHVIAAALEAMVFDHHATALGRGRDPPAASWAVTASRRQT